jgi:hypothetical protein
VYVAARFLLLQVSISHLKEAFIFPKVLGRYGREIGFLARQELPKTPDPFEMFILEVNVANSIYGKVEFPILYLSPSFL